MAAAGIAWVERLPADLAGQRAILRRLLAACESNAAIRWLVIACSVGRGAGERLPPEHQAMLPDAMSRYVTSDLAEMVVADRPTRTCSTLGG